MRIHLLSTQAGEYPFTSSLIDLVIAARVAATLDNKAFFNERDKGFTNEGGLFCDSLLQQPPFSDALERILRVRVSDQIPQNVISDLWFTRHAHRGPVLFESVECSESVQLRGQKVFQGFPLRGGTLLS